LFRQLVQATPQPRDEQPESPASKPAPSIEPEQLSLFS
jgi:hypothetical protein